MEYSQDDAADDESEELEEQTIFKNVHEALQVLKITFLFLLYSYV